MFLDSVLESDTEQNDYWNILKYSEWTPDIQPQTWSENIHAQMLEFLKKVLRIVPSSSSSSSSSAELMCVWVCVTVAEWGEPG